MVVKALKTNFRSKKLTWRRRNWLALSQSGCGEGKMSQLVRREVRTVRSGFEFMSQLSELQNFTEPVNLKQNTFKTCSNEVNED